jgi:hypothetical protein
VPVLDAWFPSILQRVALPPKTPPPLGPAIVPPDEARLPVTNESKRVQDQVPPPADGTALPVRAVFASTVQSCSVARQAPPPLLSERLSRSVHAISVAGP